MPKPILPSMLSSKGGDILKQSTIFAPKNPVNDLAFRPLNTSSSSLHPPATPTRSPGCPVVLLLTNFLKKNGTDCSNSDVTASKGKNQVQTLVTGASKEDESAGVNIVKRLLVKVA